MINNLHLVYHPLRLGSRILKQTASLYDSRLIKHIYIAALHEDGLNRQEEINNGRSIWRARLRTRNLPRIFIFQLLQYSEFCLRVIAYARTKQIRLVNVHSLALLPLGVLTKWIFSAKLVYDAHELETETFALSGAKQAFAKLVERAFIKQANLVIVVSPSINEWYRGRYGLTNVITTLNCPDSQAPRRHRDLHHEFRISAGRRIVLYLGGFNRGRGIEALLNSFSEFDDGKHVLLFMGHGELDGLITSYANSHPNIFLKRAVPPAEVLEWASGAHVGIAYIDNPSLNDHFCLPNKLFEYIAAGLPVIVNNAPEMRRLVTENKIGVVLEELTTESLTAALTVLSKWNSEVLSANLLRTAKEYSWQNQAKVMIKAYRAFVLTDEDDMPTMNTQSFPD